METLIMRKLEALGMTRHKLAKEIGMNRAKIYEVAIGFRRATLSYQEPIAKVLGVTPESLFDENGMARLVKE